MTQYITFVFLILSMIVSVISEVVRRKRPQNKVKYASLRLLHESFFGVGVFYLLWLVPTSDWLLYALCVLLAANAVRGIEKWAVILLELHIGPPIDHNYRARQDFLSNPLTSL